MRMSVFATSILALPVAICSVSAALAVAPYTQDFSSGPAGWYDNTSAVLLTPQSSGGPDGGAYASTSRNTVSLANVGDPVTVFRNQSSLATSDSAFFGDWIGSGINHFSMDVLQNSGAPLSFFVRFANPAAFPGVNALASTPVPSGVWTHLDYVINFGQLGLSLAPESNDPNDWPSFYQQVFSNVTRIQVGFGVPASLIHNNTSFTYGIDKVSIATPEPASVLLICAGLIGGAFIRRPKS